MTSYPITCLIAGTIDRILRSSFDHHWAAEWCSAQPSQTGGRVHRQRLTVLESWSVTSRHHSTRDTGLMIVAPRQIEGVIVSLPALTEGPTVIDPDTVTPVQVFEAVPAAITVSVFTCALAFWYYFYMEHTKLRCSYPSLQHHNSVQVSEHLPGGVSVSLTASNTVLYFHNDEMFTCHSVVVSTGILPVGYQGVSSLIQISNTRMWRLHVWNITKVMAGRYELMHFRF